MKISMLTAGQGVLLLIIGICIYALVSYAVAYVLIKTYAPLSENGENAGLDDIP